MDYAYLGHTGVQVSRICLGTAFRASPDEGVCRRTIERAIDLGCNFIDCANSYGGGRSEQILGRAIRHRRDELVITSKVWSPIGSGVNDRGLSRFHILREVERSLTRLGTDHLDLYFLHHVDPRTPQDETLRAMDDLVRQGKVRYVGASNYRAWQVADLLRVADLHGWDRLVCLQHQYSLLARRELEPDMFPLCAHYGLGMITYSPLAVGLLTGRYRLGHDLPPGSPWTPERLRQTLSVRGDGVLQCLAEVAGAHGCTCAQVAIAWLLTRPWVTAPIIGPDAPEHVDEACGALAVQLTAADLTALDEASAPADPGLYL